MPRSWPSNPILATSTRQAHATARSVQVPNTSSSARSDLADRDVTRHRVEDRRHQVDGGIGGVAADAGERGAHAVVVALGLHPLEARQLSDLDRGVDAQRGGDAVVAVDVVVHAHDHELARVDAPLEVVGGVGDLALEPALLDGAQHAVEHRAVALVAEVRERLLRFAAPARR